MDSVPSRRPWLLASVAPFFALALTRPWVREAFPLWDYPDVLPILRRTQGLWDGVRAIAEFNRPDGRANYLSYFQFSATWELVGGAAVGWQLQRGLFMLAAAVLLVWVARRLGATPLAAALGAALFIVAVPSTEGWLFLAAEPLTTVLLLVMVLVGAGYRTTPAWRIRAVLLAALAGLVMLSKEVHALLLPLPILFAVCWDPERGFRRPSFEPRERWLALLLLGVIALETWSVLAALRDGRPGNYASSFGHGGLDAGRAFIVFQAVLLPARFSSAGIGTLLYPANLLILTLLLVGLVLPSRTGPRPSGWGWWVLGLLAFAVIGAITYGLWPRYSAFYGIPYFAGSIGLLVLAASWIERQHHAGRVIVAGLGGLVVFFTAIVAARTIRQKHATADFAVRISRALAASPRLDTLLVVTPRQGTRRWPITARELRHYALFLGEPDAALPVMEDASCEHVAQRLRYPLGRNAVLNDQNSCGRLPAQTVTWVAALDYLDWTSFARATDTLRVDLLAPSWRPGHSAP